MLASLFSETEVLYQTLAEDYVQDSWISIWKKKPRSLCLLLSWAFSVESLTLGQMAPSLILGSLTALSSLLLLPFLTLYSANPLVRVNTVYSIHPLMESFLLLVWHNWKAKLTPTPLCRLPQCTATPHTQEGRGKGCPAPHSPPLLSNLVFHFLITSFFKEDNSGGWF